MAFMDEHEKFLTDCLFSEKTPITYRKLSKALDIHVNAAKGLLFQFYQSQSLERKSTIRATYLVYGTLVPSALAEDDDDGVELSSQATDSLQLAKKSKLTLVEEERLQGNETSRDEAENNASVGKRGTIHNSRARMRERHTAPVTVVSRAVTLTSSTEQADAAKKPPLPCPIPNERSQSQPRKPATTTSSGRKASGNIFQSFAKTTAKAQVKTAESAKKEDDSATALSDDGDADDSDVLPTKEPQLRSVVKTRTQREEALRRMMEEEEDADKSDADEASADDEKMEDTADPEPEPEVEAKTEAEAEAEAQPDSVMSGCDGPSETISSVKDGRRRGKRRVVKKKRILDEQGYMVTIQEPGWESFSEDDTTQPPVKKPTSASVPNSSAKSKKSSSKAVQGSIMSFFNKK
ncbi:hypothetical protein E4U42_007757 [Claviceps africana]|uniref:DNA polymerase delta subunit 3 n=1 Tax=Claviceps africana TaxID=83212 RepID=A0A8K0JBA3_9HYPO|nr:hypothetical protein E4U42_007757 [Claviceps africana]